MFITTSFSKSKRHPSGPKRVQLKSFTQMWVKMLFGPYPLAVLPPIISLLPSFCLINTIFTLSGSMLFSSSWVLWLNGWQVLDEVGTNLGQPVALSLVLSSAEGWDCVSLLLGLSVPALQSWRGVI